MPELIRSVVSRLRIYVNDRRQSPRLRIRLLFTVSLRRATNGNGLNKPKKVLRGHTRDISSNGLALLLPQAHAANAANTRSPACRGKTWR